MNAENANGATNVIEAYIKNNRWKVIELVLAVIVIAFFFSER